MNYVRRFVFVHYEDLLEVRFRQLEKVTDKLYVFVPAGTEEVPFWLVRQMQDMGRDLIWVDIGEATYAEAQLAIAFHAGHLHAQADPGVEFALLSDARATDALVRFMQATGRVAIRVKRRPQQDASAPFGKTDDDGGLLDDGPHVSQTPRAAVGPDRDHADDIEDLDRVTLAGAAAGVPPKDNDGDGGDGDGDDGGDGHHVAHSRHAKHEPRARHALAEPSGGGRDRVRLPNGFRHAGLREPLDRQTAIAPADRRPNPAKVTALMEEIVRKLIRSGERPAEVQQLRSYILLHAPNPEAGHYVDEVIAAMAEKGEIEVSGEEVRYGF